MDTIQVEATKELVDSIKKLEGKIADAIYEFNKETNDYFRISVENIYNISSTYCGESSYYTGSEITLKLK